ncbi:hypothetical protein N7528_002154 [Penicillium herquei]|nr:hypothetical protein N7528_002154 [Penicillium herquei]
MSMRASSAMRLSSWLGSSYHQNCKFNPFRRIAFSVITIGALFLVLYAALPSIYRFRFHLGYSWYDLGYYGLGPSRTYQSFDEQSPLVEISPVDATCDQRYTFLAPRGDSVEHPGPMIIDANGELVWMKYNWGTTQDFKVQSYKGKDYLTYWQGDEEDGYGHGSWYMLDSTYTPRYIVSPAGDLDGDLHDLQITVNDTALLLIYEPIPADLTALGGPEHGWLYEGVIQEIDIETGELLFEWRSSKTYPPEDSFHPLNGRGHERALGYDYFHLNSVDKNDEGHYLISARHTHTVTCIDSNGEVLWTLGGKQNSFTNPSNGPATEIAWQHDARWRGPNRITLFNNAVTDVPFASGVSHGLSLELDVPTRSVKVLTRYDHPQRVMSISQGNLQVLDTGNVLVGWGHTASFTEFTPDGEVVCNTNFGAAAWFNFGRIVSYRVFKDSWVGTPNTLPDIAVSKDRVFVSWNGATEVAAWVLEGWDGDSLTDMMFVPIGKVNRLGFETEIPLTPDVKSYFRVAAVNSNGEVLGWTEVHSRTSKSLTSLSGNFQAWVFTIIIVFSVGCLFFAIYRAVHRRLGSRKPDIGALYQLIGHDEDGNDREHENLPI